MSIEINGAGVITGVDSLSTPAVTNAAGSASTPSITFTGDTNTGLYSPGADQVAISTGGTGRLFIDSAGRVLVGTSNDLSNYNAQIANADGDGFLSMLSYSSTASYGVYVTLNHSKSGTLGTHTLVSSGDMLGTFRFRGSDGSSFVDSAAITAEVDGTPGANDMPGRLVFSVTSDGSSSPTERLRIANNGALGLSGANYGTSGQVLTSQGSGAAPQWATPAGGSMVFISSVTASNSASVAFTSGIDSTYDVYVITGIGVIPSQDSKLVGRTSANGGSSYDSSGGDYSTSGYNQDITVGTQTVFELTGNIESTSSSGSDFEFYMYNPSNTTRRKYMRSHTFRQTPNAGTWNNSANVHMRHSTSSINAIQFFMEAGNISTGTLRLYGIKNS